MKKRNITVLLAAVVAAVLGFYGIDIDLSSIVTEKQPAKPSFHLASSELPPDVARDLVPLEATQVLGSHPSTSHFRDRVYGDFLPQSGVSESLSDSLF